MVVVAVRRPWYYDGGDRLMFVILLVGVVRVMVTVHGLYASSISN
jgi:hypothetical protein